MASSMVSAPMQQESSSRTSTGGRADGASAPSFHKAPHVFRPRFSNKNADDPLSGIMYDGKRMRKAIHRKTVDYNPSILKYLQVWYKAFYVCF